MTFVDMVGFSAAAASFVAFSAKTMIPLRIAAICSNVLFIAFGSLSGFWPSAPLHTLLLPLNIHRLRAMHRLVRRVAVAARAEDVFESEWLRPYMRRKSFTKGRMIFAKGRARTRRLLHRIGPGAFSGGRRARRQRAAYRRDRDIHARGTANAQLRVRDRRGGSLHDQRGIEGALLSESGVRIPPRASDRRSDEKAD